MQAKFNAARKWAACVVRLLLVAAIVAANCAATAAADEESGRLLGEVCATATASKTSKQVPIFTSPSQVRRLIVEHARQKREAAAAAGDGSMGSQLACSSEYDASFEELNALLEPQTLEDVCSTQMYDLIRAYHTKFIHFYLPEMTRDELLAAKKLQQQQHASSGNANGNGKDETAVALAGDPLDLHANQQAQPLKPIPRALRNFFILFAKQIGAACKQHLVAYMTQHLNDAQDKITSDHAHLPNDEDFAVLERYKRESQRLGFLYSLTKLGMSSYGRSSASDFNELQILDLIGARVKGAELEEGAKLYVQVRFDDRLKRIKAACELRFMPVYLDLFGPVIKLNNLAYIDRARGRVEDKELANNEGLRRWFDIIQACEVLKDIEVLHDSSAMSAIVGIIQDNSHLQAADANKQAQLRKVKILNREEATRLRNQLDGRADADEDLVRPSYDPELAHFPHQPIAFTPRMWLTKRSEIERELKYFDRDVDKFVWQRTSLMRQWRQELTMQLKSFFHRHKNELVERDETSTLGQLAIFFERHRLVLTGISLCMSLIFLTTIVAG